MGARPRATPWILAAAFACGPAGAPEGGEPESEPLVGELGGAAERAMVRALLDGIEREHRPEDIPPEEVRALYESRVEGRPLPARPPLAQMESELRAELANRARLRALVDRVAELEREIGVERDEAAIDALATLPIRFEDEAR